MKGVDKDSKKEIMRRIEEAGDPENYETSWDEKGIPSSKSKSKVKMGRVSRAAGARFELKVRKDLEGKGRIVDKWSNNVDLKLGKVVPAKRKFNPFAKVLTIGVGFPDFVSIKRISEGIYSVTGVEVKVNGTLSKEEKEKCAWYLKEGIFSEIWIAKSVREGRKIGIEYIDFK